MKISLVIPVRNESNTISQSLIGLQWLRQAGHEIILVDGRSEDNTCEVAYPLVDKLLESDAGRARQMNMGANSATGDTLIFLHIDTTFSLQALHELNTALSERNMGWGRFDIRLSGYHPAFRVIETLMNVRSRLSGIATGDQAIFMTKQLFELVGGFPIIPLMEDVEMSRQLKKHGRPICLRTRITTSSRRWETHGIVKTIFMMWKFRFLYWLGIDSLKLAKQYYN